MGSGFGGGVRLSELPTRIKRSGGSETGAGNSDCLVAAILRDPPFEQPAGVESMSEVDSGSRIARRRMAFTNADAEDFPALLTSSTESFTAAWPVRDRESGSGREPSRAPCVPPCRGGRRRVWSTGRSTHAVRRGGARCRKRCPMRARHRELSRCADFGASASADHAPRSMASNAPNAAWRRESAISSI